MKYVLHSLLFIFLFASCATTNIVSIDVRQPALLTFTPDMQNIIIVDNSSLYNEDIDADKESGIMTMDSAKAYMMHSLKLFMNEEKYFNDVDIYPSNTYTGRNEDLKLLSRSKVQSICKEKSADALISLDFFTVSAELESDVVSYFNNYSILRAKLGSVLNVYTKYGEPMSSPIVYLDSLYREGSQDWSQINRSTSDINNLITEISTYAADKLTAKFIPSWNTQYRWYYTDSSKEMKEAALFASQEKWAQASDIWGEVFDKEKSVKKKIKSALNIALANEYLDDIENANSWIQIASDLLPEKESSQLRKEVVFYEQILNDRLKKRTRLSEQLGLGIYNAK